MANAIQIEGLDELRRDLRRIKDSGLNQAMRDANRELAEEVVQKALPNVPVQSGRLKASVRGSGNLAGAIGRVGGAGVPYAAAIHWGSRTRNIPRRPFLTDAAAQVETSVVDRYSAAIDALFDAIRA